MCPRKVALDRVMERREAEREYKVTVVMVNDDEPVADGGGRTVTVEGGDMRIESLENRRRKTRDL